MKYNEIPILMYHEIGYKNNLWSVSPEDFKQQMEFLKRNGFQTISLSQLKDGLEKNKTTNKKKVVITFDDGRSGVYDYAYPILSIYNFTATLFIVPAWVGQKEIPGHENYSSFTGWQQIKELASNGFEIGSHSLTHAKLIELGPEELKKELQNSKLILEQKTGKKILHFAYPYGKYNDEVKKEALNHYATAVTTKKGFDKKEGEYARQWVTNLTSPTHFINKLSLPTISLAMIVKNEEDVLEECLNSVKDLVDEVVIVDTGSTDNTKAIAQKFTAKVFDFNWNGDFAEARNESLKYATCDWILILDADEAIASEDIAKIKQAVNEEAISAFRIVTLNYTNNSSITGWQPVKNSYSRTFTGFFPSIKIRLFQNNKEIAFSGRIHEIIDEKTLGKVENLDLAVHHYSQKERKEKNSKYLELGKKKIEDLPDDPKAYFELGVQYKNSGEFNLAETALKQSLELEKSLIALLNLALVQQKQGKTDEAIEIYKQALEMKPSAEAYFGLGYCYYTKNDLESSSENFIQAIKLNPNNVEAYINLGAIYEKKKDFNSAIKMVSQAIHFNPNNARAFHNLGVIYEKTLNINQAIEAYNQSIELNYIKKEELKQRVEKIKSFLQT